MPTLVGEPRCRKSLSSWSSGTAPLAAATDPRRRSSTGQPSSSRITLRSGERFMQLLYQPLAQRVRKGSYVESDEHLMVPRADFR